MQTAPPSFQRVQCTRPLLFGGLWLALAGCGPAQDANAEPESNILLLDENNYRSRGDLSVPRVETASASDIEICWDALTSDFQCHEVAPRADVDNVALLRLRLSPEQAEKRLGDSELAMSEVDGYLDFKTDHSSTCTQLSNMSFFGTPIEVEQEYVQSDEHTYVLLFAQGTTPGVGARSMLFVTPTATSTNTRVAAPEGCGLLEFEAELADVVPVAVPAQGPWRIGWRDITRDSRGNAIVFENIDGGLLGFYAGMTLSQLEQQVFDLEQLASSLWEVELTSVRTTDLALAIDRKTGQRFGGFDRDEAGVWLLALTCSTCQNPAPIVLAALEPSAGSGR